MDDKFVRLRLFENKPHHPFAQIHKLVYCKLVHWYGWTKVVAQTRKSFSISRVLSPPEHLKFDAKVYAIHVNSIHSFRALHNQRICIRIQLYPFKKKGRMFYYSKSIHTYNRACYSWLFS
jgi:hypothetical protein